MTTPNRYDQQTLQSLAAALAGGLDPMQGLSIWNGLQSDMQARQQAQQQQQMEKMDALRQLAVQNAEAGQPRSFTQTQFEGLYPNMSPKMSMGLDDTLANLYGPTPDSTLSPLAAPSPLAPPPPPPPPAPLATSPNPAVPAFDMEDAQAVSQMAASIIGSSTKATTANPNPVTPDFDAVRRQVAAQLGPMYAAYQGDIDRIIVDAYQNVTGQGPNFLENLARIGPALSTTIANRPGY